MAKRRLKIIAVSERTPECARPDELNGHYRPLSRTLFVDVSTRVAERPDVGAFVEYLLGRVEATANRVGYVSLPGDAYARVQERFKAQERRTASGGEVRIGLRVRDLLDRGLG